MQLPTRTVLPPSDQHCPMDWELRGNRTRHIHKEPRVWWRDRYIPIRTLRGFARATSSSSKTEKAQRRTWDGLGLVVTEAFMEEVALES